MCPAPPLIPRYCHWPETHGRLKSLGNPKHETLNPETQVSSLFLTHLPSEVGSAKEVMSKMSVTVTVRGVDDGRAKKNKGGGKGGGAVLASRSVIGMQPLGNPKP